MLGEFTKETERAGSRKTINSLQMKESATSEEEKINVVHDLLAYLAEQMIKMNKDKQA
jgi:hypothetical protein